MGFYINPQDCSKEDWLRLNGTIMDGPVPATTREGHRPVCLVDNGPFTAAAICYNDDEVEAFSQSTDRRAKLWFVVPVEKLVEVCPDVRSRVL